MFAHGSGALPSSHRFTSQPLPASHHSFLEILDCNLNSIICSLTFKAETKNLFFFKFLSSGSCNGIPELRKMGSTEPCRRCSPTSWSPSIPFGPLACVSQQDPFLVLLRFGLLFLLAFCGQATVLFCLTMSLRGDWKFLKQALNLKRHAGTKQVPLICE